MHVVYVSIPYSEPEQNSSFSNSLNAILRVTLEITLELLNSSDSFSLNYIRLDRVDSFGDRIGLDYRYGEFRVHSYGA